MNRRQAKKRVKRIWHIDRFPADVSPREVERFAIMTFYKLMAEKFEKAILYGLPEKEK